ncbi:hypothetical protein [Kribbella sp. NBC_00359]|uniref:hypothetical protein n=1 Tax=Kribbella sp. NBC_00359 TaxID=2975966 RepID=UPI002E22F07F
MTEGLIRDADAPYGKLGVATQVAGVPSQAAGVDLLAWLKVPGTSDGTCGLSRTIPAGTFSPPSPTT